MTITKELADEVRESWHRHWSDEDVKARMDDLADMIYAAYVAGFVAGKRKQSREGGAHENSLRSRNGMPSRPVRGGG